MLGQREMKIYVPYSRYKAGNMVKFYLKIGAIDGLPALPFLAQ
jgi:hypothetical protein